MKAFIAALAVYCLIASAARAEPPQFAPAGPKDKCPVCGMFVAPYKNWTARIHFKDGSFALFDGPKDMFKYYQNLTKYAPGKDASAITAIYVIEYYGLQPLDARQAFFAVGSDVYGPMGKELVPCATQAQAAEFQKDHKAAKLLRFPEITPDIIKALD